MLVRFLVQEDIEQCRLCLILLRAFLFHGLNEHAPGRYIVPQASRLREDFDQRTGLLNLKVVTVTQVTSGVGCR